VSPPSGEKESVVSGAKFSRLSPASNLLHPASTVAVMAQARTASTRNLLSQVIVFGTSSVRRVGRAAVRGPGIEHVRALDHPSVDVRAVPRDVDAERRPHRLDRR